MRFYIIYFVIGVTAANQFSALPDLYQLFCLITAAGWLIHFKHLWLRYLGIALLGLSWTFLDAHWQMQFVLPPNLENKSVVVQGTITSLPEINPQHATFNFSITQWHTTVRLNWYQPPLNLTAGQQWQLQVKLKPLHSFANLGSFDYAQKLFSEGIRASGYVTNSVQNKCFANHLTAQSLTRLRQYLRDKLLTALKGQTMAGMIPALVVGSQENITEMQWQIFRATGTVHLMIIAGLHIGFMTGSIFFMTRWLWSRSQYLTLRFPASHAARLVGFASAVIYSLLAGLSIPTQRAVITIGIFMLCQIGRRYHHALDALLLALFIIVLINPFAVLDSGFWLSFAAVTIILYGMMGRLHMTGWYWHFGRVQWVLCIGLLPVCLWFYQQASLISFIANFIVVPWVGFIVVPLSLIGTLLLLICPTFGKTVLICASKATSLLWPLLNHMAQWQFATLHLAISNITVLTSTVISALLILAPRGFPGRSLAIIGLLPLFFQKPLPLMPGEIYFNLLDVGQGLSAIVITAHHVLIYDTGPRFSADFDMGEAVVVPYLLQLHQTKIDTIIISHSDSDHSGGAHSILKALPVKQILTSAPQLLAEFSPIRCHAGQSWIWDGVLFEILYPPSIQSNLDNNSSCVLRISNTVHSILLPGDIEKFSEQTMLNTPQLLYPVDILVAPHHGSKTSSTQKFIHALAPKFILFPIGYLNRFHFPNKDVVARYQQIGAKSYDTAQCGSIGFLIGLDHVIKLPECYRQQQHRYWMDS